MKRKLFTLNIPYFVRDGIVKQTKERVYTLVLERIEFHLEKEYKTQNLYIIFVKNDVEFVSFTKALR